MGSSPAGERKIKCDETLPTCLNCSKKHRQCRHVRLPPLKWVSSPALPFTQPTEDPAPSRPFQGDTSWAHQIATLSPRESLEYPTVVSLFTHYTTHLAPWYDLNDPHSLFTNAVPIRSLDEPILFRAILAFAASHLSRMIPTSSLDSTPVAVILHDSFLSSLISALSTITPSTQANYLAATCLLRSYEILNGDTRMAQQHLFGAFSLAVHLDIDLSTWGLAQAGFWNYLCEDITVALECRRPLHMRMMADRGMPRGMTEMEQDWGNAITWVLAELVNLQFTEHEEDGVGGGGERWECSRRELEEWKVGLPTSFEPISRASKEGNVFPSLWMLRPWYVAARQYAAVAEILLVLSKPGQALDSEGREMRVQELALQVCGLAFTNEDVPARVNAFGPLAFCGRFLRESKYRSGLRCLLRNMARQTGWNVDYILKDLYECWGESDLNS
ncbi:uncharacterized protein BDZ99DRAFT_576908 [Mytilinidion resinicola]|uniref:Zn(2)-C6 fungal-type domain-containing protein n=1 Tax=Mytilinidion resinicola TaxID=574789 RepID=A0A6A6Y2H3_9PEZI|nr:uncharacterized protein BDZ99DRAFT_576908 [Mytilinidion resinicola]KAF2802204.1 hypothetical protein BDZ99DRAFT_576908 [Mytilinidion resinicola]